MNPSYREERKGEWVADEIACRDAFGEAAEVDLLTGLLDGPPVPPTRGIPWLAETCVDLVVDDWDSVIAITGKERVSKSTFALQFALRAADLVGRPWDFSRLCYSAREVLLQYRAAKPGDVIWLDEGARGLWAGDTFEPEQKALTKALTLVGETGAILVICVPDIWLLARKVRGRRARFWAHVETRGTRRAPAPSRALLFERDDRLHFKPTAALGLAPSRRCPTITYDPFPLDDPVYQEYRRTKKRKLADFYDETIEELDRLVPAQREGRRPARRSLSGEGDADGGET